MEQSRNAPCLCGSGRKYKRCCGAESRKKISAPAFSAHRLEACSFSCATECAEICCGGATLLTIDEIRNLWRVFPITAGFRKYRPASPRHLAFLEIIGTRIGEHFVVGDFIAGNRFASRCPALGVNSLCDLHSSGLKPKQCVIVPFCAIYPEDMQDVVFAEQRQSAFRQCRGYTPSGEECFTVWRRGRFTDETTRAAFYAFQRGLRRQKPFMEKILRALSGESSFDRFLAGEGMLEAAPSAVLLFEILEGAGFDGEQTMQFVTVQRRLCEASLSGTGSENQVLRDYQELLAGIEKTSAGRAGSGRPLSAR